MKKRFHLYYLFREEFENTKLSREKSAEIRKIIENFFHALKQGKPALPMNQEVEQEGKE